MNNQTNIKIKKILEVIEERDGQLKFDTDLDVSKELMVIMDLIMNAMLSMATKLWGRNEQSVLAVIRALSVADLAISCNRKEMLKMLECHTEEMGNVFQNAMKELEGQGKAISFPPGVKPPCSKNKN